jgi:hypothetical protein
MVARQGLQETNNLSCQASVKGELVSAAALSHTSPLSGRGLQTAGRAGRRLRAKGGSSAHVIYHKFFVLIVDVPTEMEIF